MTKDNLVDFQYQFSNYTVVLVHDLTENKDEEFWQDVRKISVETWNFDVIMIDWSEILPSNSIYDADNVNLALQAGELP